VQQKETPGVDLPPDIAAAVGRRPMDITEVRIRLLDARRDRLRAYATITLDQTFVVRDLRIIEGGRGVFVAMPSRRLADRCPRCACKNHLRAEFCNECGVKLPTGRVKKDAQGRARLHCDVCHPVNREARERFEGVVLARYYEEMEKHKHGLYKPPPGEDFEFEEGAEYDHE
jgi:stage V sporulation protein G